MTTTLTPRQARQDRPTARPARTITGQAARFLRRLPIRAVIAALLIIEIYPFIWLFLGSVKSQNDYLTRSALSLPTHWIWSNYRTAWVTGQLGTYIRNSLLATLPSLTVVIVLGVAAGFALQVMRWRLRRGVMLMFLAGIMVPSQTILLPLFTVYYQTGLSGHLWPLPITYTATGLPLTVFMMATYFRAVPVELFEAAALDGAGILRTFWSIGFPLVRNAVLTVGLVQFFFIWNDLLIALTFTNSASLRTIQVGLLNFTGQFGSIQYGPLFAAICVNVFGILLIYLFLNQRVMKGLAGGALKG